ncbi:MAG: methyltransferase domain-containing protein [Betaproteobacteria bacterium]|nr:methyltransferase domain-containing protein [Betaproteobacteria bacterium]
MPQRVLALPLVLCALFLLPQSVAADFEPKVGQPGKDVIWVPTPNSLVERMLDMAQVTPKDFLVDLGSGDGRTVIAAAKRGIKALGIEFNADMVALSRANAERTGVGERASFVHGDVFKEDFSQASVVTMYLLSSLNIKLRPTLLNMKPGTRVVSHAFNMGDWGPDETSTVNGYTAYMWIVPAKVQGRWQGTGPSGAFELTLDQTYQKVTGKVTGSGLAPNVADPILEGNKIQFTLVDSAGRFLRFRGTVNGNAMEGTAQVPGGTEAHWSARRAG